MKSRGHVLNQFSFIRSGRYWCTRVYKRGPTALYFLGENAREFLGTEGHFSLPGAFLVDFTWAFSVDFVHNFLCLCGFEGFLGTILLGH